MEAQTLFRDGKLPEAIEACQQRLRQQPDDATHRTFLFELLAFAGLWDRAQRQLQFLEQHQPGSEWAAQVYQNLLVAEQLREQWARTGQTLPGFLLDPPDYLHRQCDAVRAFGQGDGQRAAELLAEVTERRPIVQGRFGGEPFQEVRDCDDLLAPVLELMILRDYVWLPWEQIRELEVSRPERPRDLIWAPVRVELIDGSQRRGYTPTRYPLSYTSDDIQVKLGRMTDWNEQPGGIVTGLGLKTILLGDRDATVLELERVEFVADGV
ncbi:MAG: type VI secretion system accessory protein TagJ [Pirellulales bacterium]